MLSKTLIADVGYFGLDDDGFVHAKRTAERWHLVFDFNKRLAGATVSSAAWTATAQAGTDDDAQDIVSGSASNASGKSTQLVIDGVDGVTYLIIGAATLSDTRIIHGVGFLKVSNAVR